MKYWIIFSISWCWLLCWWNQNTLQLLFRMCCLTSEKFPLWLLGYEYTCFLPFHNTARKAEHISTTSIKVTGVKVGITCMNCVYLIFLCLSCLTLNVRGQSYLGWSWSISWLLIPWLHTSPGHQQHWYWLCRICRSWSCILSTHVTSMWSNDIKCKYMFIFPLKHLAHKQLSWFWLKCKAVAMLVYELWNFTSLL